MEGKYFIVIIFLVIILSGCNNINQSNVKNSKKVPFSTETCYSMTLRELQADDSWSSEYYKVNFVLEDISEFKCGWESGYWQFEVKGFDVDGNSFQYNYLAEGGAASGEGDILDRCVIINNKKIKSERVIQENHREENLGEGTCSFDDSLNMNRESTYSFVK